MKRRTLLSAVAAGGLAGCLSSEREPAVLGFDGSVEVIVCGGVVSQSCSEFADVEFDTGAPEQLSSKSGGHAGARRADGRVRVEGDILGIGDPDCRQTRVPVIELREGVLDIVVTNDESRFASGCEENARYVNYLISVNREDSKRVETVQISHYEYDGKLTLSGFVTV